MKTFKRPQFSAILAAHAAGRVVTWKNPGYVLKGPPDHLLVIFTANGNAAGLFHRDEEASSYDPADFTITPPVQTPAQRLEYLRGEIEAERISYGEIHELQTLAEYIEPGDVQLLEWAGVPENA